MKLINILGIIIFLSLNCSTQMIVVKETGIAQLTQVTTDQSFEIDPVFSPNGGTIVFASNRSGLYELWQCSSIGGGGFTQLTASTGLSWDRAPQFSPDGKTIIFQSNRVAGISNIWALIIGDRGLAQLTNFDRGCYSPSWSPDGGKIVFTALNQKDKYDIWTMNADGSELIQLTDGTDPCYSPDGKRIAFSKKMKESWDIWIMNSDGTNQIQITSDPERQEYGPSWTPDGNYLAYMAQFSEKELLILTTTGYSECCLIPTSSGNRINANKYTLAGEKKSEIWLKNIAEGRKEIQLTAFEGINAYPSWSPDGKKIVFSSNRSENWDIWTMVPSK